MKKVCLLLTLAFAAFAGVYAQTNNLVVYSDGGEKFFLILNGAKQNATVETNVKVTGLNQPGYKAKIIFEDKKIADCNGNIQFMWGGEDLKGAEMVYVVKKDKKGIYKLKPQSQTSIASAPVTTNQQTVVYTTTDATVPPPTNNTSTTTTTGTSTTTTNGTSTGVNIGINADGTGLNMNVNVTDPTLNGTGTSTSTTTTTTTTSSSTTVNGNTTGSSTTTTTNGTGGNVNMNVNMTDGNYNPNTGTPQHGTDPVPNNTTTTTTTYVMPGYNGPIGCAWPMSDADFASAKKSIESKSFEDNNMYPFQS